MILKLIKQSPDGTDFKIKPYPMSEQMRTIICIDPEHPWPESHHRDTDYRKCCVRCGDLVHAYQRLLTSEDRPYPSSYPIHTEPHKMLFGGRHCDCCYETVKHCIENAIVQLTRSACGGR